MAKRLKLSDIEQMEDEFLKPDVIASVIGCSPQMIRNQAEQETKSLGFPISKIGHGYWIPKEGFLNWARHSYQMIVMEGGVKCGRIESGTTRDYPVHRRENHGT